MLRASALAIALAGCADHSESGATHPAESNATRGPIVSMASSLVCDDARFLKLQRSFADGLTQADQLVDVCGTVTAVLAPRTTRSGTHGYFYLTLAPNASIEIVANLDAMARAPSDRPPSWPWVGVGNYVYVQGRYFYDSPRRQGIDWTEDDTGRSWPYTGYVTVCNTSRTNCSKYW